jgi:hypothetical protein
MFAEDVGLLRKGLFSESPPVRGKIQSAATDA